MSELLPQSQARSFEEWASWYRASRPNAIDETLERILALNGIECTFELVVAFLSSAALDPHVNRRRPTLQR